MRPVLHRLALAALVAAALLIPAAAQAQGGASPYTSGTRLDEDGRVTGTIAPDPDGAGPLRHTAVRSSYDSAGRLVKVETGELAAWQSEAVAPASWTGFTVFQTVASAYDAMGRKLLDVASSGGTVYTVTQTSYDSMGRTSCVAVRMNPALYPTAAATGGGLPASACTLGAQGSQGPDRITRNLYHVNGQVEIVQEAYGTALQQNYASYTYSANGRRTSLTDANGNRAEMSYDGLDRQKRWTFPSSGAPGKPPLGQPDPGDYEQYGYDAAGNRVSLRKRDGVTIGYSYDALNRLEQKTVPASASGAPGYSVFYGYDLRGLQTYARFGSAAGEGVTNGYDGLGRLASTSIDLGGTVRSIAYRHDSNGNRTGLTATSGYIMNYLHDGADRVTAIEETGPNRIAQLSYDAVGRRSLLLLGSGGIFTSSASYRYDPVGRLNSLVHDLAGASTATDQSQSFTYNPASQIVTRTSLNDAYAFTAAANVSRSYSVNGLNQYVSVSSTGYEYDANGNLTFDGSTRYLYDSENRLVSATGLMNVILTYDPLGRLWQVWGSNGARRLEYDGDRLIMEYDSWGGQLRSYAWGPGVDEPLVWYEVAGGLSRRFLHADHQGSIVAAADQAGNALAITAYDPWGIPNGADVGRFGYTGQAWIGELGMYYYKARIYSPMLGRFMQTDPVGYEGGINLYAYVGNDPANNRDPDGLTPQQAAQWAWEQRGSTRYRQDSEEPRVGGLRATFPLFGNGGAGAPKCNFFVYDALVAGGVGPGRVNGEAGKIPTASSHWSNPRTTFDNYRVLKRGELPRAGDVISNSGHVGIVVGTPHARKGTDDDGKPMTGYLTVSAADRDHGDAVKMNQFGFRKSDHLEQIVVWRYVGPESKK